MTSIYVLIKKVFPVGTVTVVPHADPVELTDEGGGLYGMHVRDRGRVLISEDKVNELLKNMTFVRVVRD